MKLFATSIQHILAELERIDLLIRVQVARARVIFNSDEAFQGLYVSEHEIESLLSRPIGLPSWAAASLHPSLPEIQSALERIRHNIDQYKAESARQGIKLRLNELACLFGLSSFEIDTLLICLAMELDLRYERLYAYLQNDVTKKRPSVELVLNLLSQSFEEKLPLRQYFDLGAPLIRYHLISIFDDSSHQHPPPLLGKYLKMDDRIAGYLLGSDDMDNRILNFTDLIIPKININELLILDEYKQHLTKLAKKAIKKDNRMILYFQGPYGVGKQSTAEALCKEMGIGILVIDMDRLINNPEIPFRVAIQLVKREALFQEATIYLAGFDSLLTDDKKILMKELLLELEDQRGLTFLSGNSIWEPQDALQKTTFLRIEFQRPTYAERLRLWGNVLKKHPSAKDTIDIEAVSEKFRFTGGQIYDAAATAGNLSLWRNPKNNKITTADLYKACRLQSNRNLTSLAQKIVPHYKWEDIVLPSDRLRQLREICNHVKYGSLVYEEWGFNRKLSLCKGLNILFAGPSGTGKTMAADIIANELSLDLYKIDLSTMISKYIGETEKNLSRIFTEAETSNAILFFDEADALFGKRSEVHDSHDRYANIEISYLLQKMEEYDGVVILATNLRKNMDEAFVRRMHFTIEFPFPAAQERRRIWEKIWPERIPKSNNIDFDFLARQLEITGGNIRNIALAAAFLAADDGRILNMDHLITATHREYQKMGKVIMEGEFGEYKSR